MKIKSIRKFKPDRALFQSLLILALVFIASSFSLVLGYLLKNFNPAEYGLIRGRKEDLEITYKEVLFFFSIAMALFVLSTAFRYIRKPRLKTVVISVALVYLVAASFMILADVIYYLVFAYRITFSSVQTVLNTNPEEVKGFVKLYYSPGKIIALLIFFAGVLLIVIRRHWFVRLFGTHSFFMISSLTTCIGTLDFIQMAHSKGNGLHNMRYWDIIIGDYNEYREFNRRLAAERNSHNLSKEYADFYKQDTLQKTLVFVISESLSRRHMSLYGYTRPTTPNLDTNTGIFKFNDCVTQAALTIEAVPGLFFSGYLSKRINLIALLNKLGYETSWISNQSGWGKGDRTIVLLSKLAGTRFFTDERADNDAANVSQHYDEEILPSFERLLRKPSRKSKFIVLHLMGCHFDYEKRFPSGKKFFNEPPPAKEAANTERSRNVLNAYDNAMRYHDSVINEVIKIFARDGRGKNSALVFLSDHGEELYDYRDHAGHGFPATRASSEIPYFTLLSPDFEKNYPRIPEVMKQRVNTPYSTENNFYTLLDLLNIRSKKYRSRILRKGFFNSAYDSTAPRFVKGIDYDKMEP